VIYDSKAAFGAVTVYPSKNTVYRLQAWGVGVSPPLTIRVAAVLPQVPDSLNAVIELNQPGPLSEVSVSLRRVLRLKESVNRWFAAIKLRDYLALSNNRIALMNYSPLLQPTQPGAPPDQPVEGSLRAVIDNLAREMWRMIKM
jgi:hypothetical protein